MKLLLLLVLFSFCRFSSAVAEDDLFSVQVIRENTADTEDYYEEHSELQVEVISTVEGDMRMGVSKHVLIYHTHTYEAYEPSVNWRSEKPDENVVMVGRALAASLEALGLEVTHDTAAYEPPDLEGAYERSLDMLESRLSAGEQYDLVIDLHRDAVASTSDIKRTVNIGGIDVARFMVLIGQGTTGGYQVKPNWEANLKFAEGITYQLNLQCENLARNVKIKTGRFNQHVADCCILIECGMNTNTMEEVLAGIPYLAHAIYETIRIMP